MHNVQKYSYHFELTSHLFIQSQFWNKNKKKTKDCARSGSHQYTTAPMLCRLSTSLSTNYAKELWNSWANKFSKTTIKICFNLFLLWLLYCLSMFRTVILMFQFFLFLCSICWPSPLFDEFRHLEIFFPFLKNSDIWFSK